MNRKAVLLLLNLVSLSGAAQASLINRGGGLIYDDVLNITWLQDANFASTSGYDADGFLNWNEARAWVSNLTYYDSIRNTHYKDWRLPVALQYDTSCSIQGGGFSSGFDCSGSELGHMFYTNLGGSAGSNIANFHNSNYQLFSNIRPVYWYGTETSLNPEYNAWRFLFFDGSQDFDLNKIFSYSAWAVRNGDVTAVPEPGTYALMLAGLSMLGFIANRRI